MWPCQPQVYMASPTQSHLFPRQIWVLSKHYKIGQGWRQHVALLFFERFNSLYVCMYKIPYVVATGEPLSSEQKLWCWFSRMVSELQIRRLDGYSHFSEVEGRVAVVLGDSIKGLDKVAQSDSAVPVSRAASWHRTRNDVSVSGGRD